MGYVVRKIEGELYDVTKVVDPGGEKVQIHRTDGSVIFEDKANIKRIVDTPVVTPSTDSPKSKP
jgi:hypothetical protein